MDSIQNLRGSGGPSRSRQGSTSSVNTPNGPRLPPSSSSSTLNSMANGSDMNSFLAMTTANVTGQQVTSNRSNDAIPVIKRQNSILSLPNSIGESGSHMDDSAPFEAPLNQDTNALMEFLSQLQTMLRRNMLLQVRYWKSTFAQILGAPLIFMLMLFILQQADYANQSKATDTPASTPLEGVLSCQGRTQNDPCINILYTPSNPNTDLFMSTFASANAKRTGEPPFAMEGSIRETSFRPNRTLGIVAVPNPDFIYQYTLNNPNVTAWGITFNLETDPVPNVQYQIWYNASRIANGTDIFGRQLTSLMRGIDEVLITVLNDPNARISAKLDVTLRDWPVVPPTVLSDTIVQNLGPVFFFCCVMVIFINVLNSIVTEKEQKLRIGMEMMGLKSSVYWTSQFLSNSVLVVGSASVTTILGLAFGFNAFRNTNVAVIFLTFFLLGEAMITFAFFLTTFVRRSRIAIMIGIFIFIIGLLLESFVFSSGFIGYIWWKTTSPSILPGLLSLLPFFNFGKIFLDISTSTTGRLDDLTSTYIPGPGFPWSALYTPVSSDLLPTYPYPDLTKPSVPPPVLSWYYLLMNIVVYAVLAWYLDHVIPNEYGYKHPIYFFVLPSYWGFGHGRGHETNRAAWLHDVLEETSFLDSAQQPRKSFYENGQIDDVEQERHLALSEDDWPSVKIVHLRKQYRTPLGTAAKVAVKDTCLTISSGKLLALLGQNGAGKSTTMNILCGLTPSSAGDALMFGHSVRGEMNKIRKIMGVCPQHDILFGDLTAKEHIFLYSGLKGVKREFWDRLAEDRLKAVRLWKVADHRVSTYSGGMKRRLSLVIATIGDPKIVFLDEPTTGMDPVNRRHVWTFIEKFKKNRVVVLTTHSMEEADVLGDRIAIMAHGRLRAIGPSLLLKNKFGAGYRISIVTDPSMSDTVKSLVSQKVPQAILEDDSAGALIYQLPSEYTTLVPAFVRYLDSDMEMGKTSDGGLVRAWGISQTTLEEVFLRLIREAPEDDETSGSRPVSKLSLNSDDIFSLRSRQPHQFES